MPTKRHAVNTAGQQPLLGELYDEILKKDFDDITLRHINTEIQDIKDGRSHYNRYDEEIRQGMLGGGEVLAAACLICRADERTGTQEPRGSFEAEKECGDRQQRLLKQWALKTDNWFDLSNLKDAELIGVGGESEVYRYNDTEVVKVNTLRYTVSPQLLFDRISIHNTLFPSTAMTVLGFGYNDYGEFSVIYTQPFVKGKTPTQKQIENFLSKLTEKNLEPYRQAGYNYKNSTFLFDDFHEENAIIDKDGRIQVIDSDIRFNTVELNLGGAVRIMPVEEEIRRDEMARRENHKTTNIDKAMKEETENKSNSVLLEGPVFSCSIIEDTKDAVRAKMEVCTAAKVKDQGVTRLTNPIIHRAIVTATGDEAAGIRELVSKTIDLTGDLSKADCVRLEGALSSNIKGQQYISVPPEGIAFLDRLSFKNKVQLEGSIKEITFNSAYAGAVLECKGANDKSVLVPVNIYSKDNPRKYGDLCSGKVKKGDVLSVKGPLISGYYSNGKKDVYLCSVNVNNYETLGKKKTQKKQATLGV